MFKQGELQSLDGSAKEEQPPQEEPLFCLGLRQHWAFRKELYLILTTLLAEQKFPLQLNDEIIPLQRFSQFLEQVIDEKQLLQQEMLSLCLTFLRKQTLGGSHENIHFLEKLAKRVSSMKAAQLETAAEVVAEIGQKHPMFVVQVFAPKKAHKDPKIALFCLFCIEQVVSQSIQARNNQLLMAVAKRLTEQHCQCRKPALQKLNQILATIFERVDDTLDNFLKLVPDEPSKKTVRDALARIRKLDSTGIKLSVTQTRKRQAKDLLQFVPDKFLEYQFMDGRKRVECANSLAAQLALIGQGQVVDRTKDCNSVFQVLVSMNEESNCLIVSACLKAMLAFLPLLGQATPKHPLRLLLSKCLSRQKPRSPSSLFRTALQSKAISSEDMYDVVLAQYQKANIVIKTFIVQQVETFAQVLHQNPYQNFTRKIAKFKSLTPAKLKARITFLEAYQKTEVRTKSTCSTRPLARTRPAQPPQAVERPTSCVRSQKLASQGQRSTSLNRQPKKPASLLDLLTHLQSKELTQLLKQMKQNCHEGFVSQLQLFFEGVAKHLHLHPDEVKAEEISQFLIALCEQLSKRTKGKIHLQLATVCAFKFGELASKVIQNCACQEQLLHSIIAKLTTGAKCTQRVIWTCRHIVNKIGRQSAANLLLANRQSPTVHKLAAALGMGSLQTEPGQSISQISQIEHADSSSVRSPITSQQRQMKKAAPPQQSTFTRHLNFEEQEKAPAIKIETGPSSDRSPQSPGREQAQFSQLSFNPQPNQNLTLELASEVRHPQYATLNCSMRQQIQQQILPILKKEFCLFPASVERLFQQYQAGAEDLLSQLIGLDKQDYLPLIKEYCGRSHDPDAFLQRLFADLNRLHLSTAEFKLFISTLVPFAMRVRAKQALSLLSTAIYFLGTQQDSVWLQPYTWAEVKLALEEPNLKENKENKKELANGLKQDSAHKPALETAVTKLQSMAESGQQLDQTVSQLCREYCQALDKRGLLRSIQRVIEKCDLKEGQVQSLLRMAVQLCSCKQSLQMLRRRQPDDLQVVERLQSMLQYLFQKTSVGNCVGWLLGLLGEGEVGGQENQFRQKLIIKSIEKLRPGYRFTREEGLRVLRQCNSYFLKHDLEQLMRRQLGAHYESIFVCLRDLTLDLAAGLKGQLRKEDLEGLPTTPFLEFASSILQ